MDHRPAKRRRVVEPPAHNHYSHLRQARRMYTEDRRGASQQDLERRNPAVVSVVATIDDVVSVVVKLDDAGAATGTATVAASANPNDALAVTSVSIPITTPVLSTTSAVSASSTITTTPSTLISSSGLVVASSATNTGPATSTPASSLAPATTTTKGSETASSSSTTPTTSASSSSVSTTFTSSTSLVNILLPTAGSFSSFSNSTLSSSGLFFKNSTTISVDSIIESTATVDESASASATPFASTTLAPMVTFTSTVTPPPIAAGATAASSSPSAGSAAANNKADDSSSSTPIAPPQTIAGAVTGSVGGAAIILAIIWLLLRWYRNRLNNKPATTLTGGQRPFAKLRGATTAESSQMSMTGNHSNFLAAAAAGCLPGRKSRAVANTNAGVNNEAGFQKVQGRKLPSQFGHDSMDAPMFHDFEADWPQPPSSHGANAASAMGAAGTAGLGLAAATRGQGSRNNLHRSMFSDHATYTESRLSRGDDLESASARGSRYMSPGDYSRPERETVRAGPARTPVIESGLYFMPPAGAYRDSQQPQGRGMGQATSSRYTDDPRGYSNPFADVPIRYDGSTARSPPGTPMVAEFHGVPSNGAANRSSRFAEVFQRSDS